MQTSNLKVSIPLSEVYAVFYVCFYDEFVCLNSEVYHYVYPSWTEAIKGLTSQAIEKIVG